MRKPDDYEYPLTWDQVTRGMQFRRLGRREFLALVSAGVGAAAVTTVRGTLSPLQRVLAAPGTPTPKAGGTLIYALVAVDDRFDPAATTYTAVRGVLAHIMEPLIWEMEPGKFSPGLAESWTVSNDASEFTFKLRQGVKFHDGTPFNAEAVKFTMDRIVSPTMVVGQARGNLGPYERTDVIDEHTARIVMKRGYSPFFGYLNSYLGIVSPTAVKQMGDAKFNFNPVGSGPFVWKEFVVNSHITLAKNPVYNWAGPAFKHKGPAYLDQVVVKIIPEPSIRMGALRTGEINFAQDVDPLALPQLLRDRNFVVIQQEQNGIPHTLLMNVAVRGDTGKPAKTAETAVRQAASFAIDRAGLTTAVYGGTAKPAWNFISPLSWGYDTFAAQMYRYDPNQAKQILDAAGWKVGRDGFRERSGERLTFDLVFRARRDEPRSEFIQANLRAVGIDCRLVALEIAAQRAAIRGRNYEGVYTWDPQSDPDMLREIAYTNGVYNRSFYSNPQVDKWLDDAMGLVSKTARKPLYVNVQRQIMRDAIGVPFSHSFLVHAQRVEVMDVHVDGMGANTIWYDAWINK
jgi:peptide/nickel transport system substrate-binding protein